MKLSNFLNTSFFFLLFSLAGQLTHAMESVSVSSAALFEAIEEGSVKRVLQLLSQGADLRAVNASGATPLHSAALLGEEAICSKLVAAGAVVNARNNTGNTPLHLAARKGHGSTCSTLVQLGAKINARNDNDETPLNVAQIAGKQEVFGILGGQAGASKAQPNLQPAPQASPLHKPAPKKSFQAGQAMVGTILKKPAQRLSDHAVNNGAAQQYSNVNQQAYAPQQAAYPPQQATGYPPQQATGYPPQQQATGYPPQQAAYPPQQATGYPPQQAGYPPQHAAYPPQQAYPQAQVKQFKQMQIARHVQPIIPYEKKSTDQLLVSPPFAKERKVYIVLEKVLNWIKFPKGGDGLVVLTDQEIEKKISAAKKIMLSGKIDLDAPYGTGTTILGQICGNFEYNKRAIELLELLLGKSIRTVNAHYETSSTPYMKACAAPLSILLWGMYGRKSYSLIGDRTFGSKLRNDASLDVSLQALKLLIKNGADVNHLNNGNSVLFDMSLSARNIRTDEGLRFRDEAMRLLIDAGAQVNQEGLSETGEICIPLFIVASNRDTRNCRKHMLDAGADVNAISYPNRDSVLTFLVKRSPFLGYVVKGSTIAHIREVITELAPMVNDINHANVNGYTVLALVCIWYSTDISLVNFLLDLGADPCLIPRSVYVFISDDCKAVFERHNPQGIRQTFGTYEEQAAKRKELEEQIMRNEEQKKKADALARANALAAQQAAQASVAANNRTHQNGSHLANAPGAVADVVAVPFLSGLLNILGNL